MDQNRKIGFGIIGTGSIAEIHVHCINEIPNAQLRAMSSSSTDRANKVSSRFNVPVYSA